MKKSAIIDEIQTDISLETMLKHMYGKHNPVILESMTDEIKGSIASYITAEPVKIFKSKGNNIEIIDMKTNSFNRFFANPLIAFERFIDDMIEESSGVELAMGYFGYDLFRFIEDIPVNVKDDIRMPDIYFGVYDCIFQFVHTTGKLILTYPESAKKKASGFKKEILELKEDDHDVDLTRRLSFTDIKSNFKKRDYIKSIEKAKDYIYSGHIYQVNLSQRFECKSSNSALELYMRLRDISPAPFSGLLSFDDFDIISSSPESFILVQNGKIITRPIKGTRKRGETKEEDDILSKELLDSEKDNAELNMIVDLERNDLGKICKYGSVNVTEPKVLEKYQTVMHLVSTVEGDLNDGVGLAEILKAVFPGGSITGCPKVRAMEIIEELEPNARNVYTGALGYISSNKNIDLSIAIRIIIKKGNRIYYQVGGGIVADSDPLSEYEETLIKGKAIVKALTGSSV